MGYSEEKAAASARKPKLSAYRLLQLLNFAPEQSAEFFRNIEAPASEKAWEEDIFFAYYDITDRLRLDPKTRDWCKLPYPSHKQGCPNYGKKAECPPAAPLVQDFVDLERPHYLAIHALDLYAFSQRMLLNHPNWSESQARNPRRWQNHVYSMLRHEISTKIQKEQIYTLIPEAMQVNVFRTLLRIGIPIRPDPILVFKVALIGSPRDQPSLDKFISPGGGPPG